MAEMTIRLIVDPNTKKKDIVISLKSDEDALPIEHEQLHRQVVDRLIEGGTLKAHEVGTVTVEREEEEEQAAAPETNAAATEERRRLEQGQGNG